MPDRPLVAGVDTSTQSCKVVVCDAETGAVVRTGRASHPDGTEVDPRHWWAAWQEASGGGILDGVSAVAVGGQQHGMVLLDEHGEVVRDALLWNDTRSAQAADDLVAELGAQAWADATGLVPVAATTVSKLRWVADPRARQPGPGPHLRAPPRLAHRPDPRRRCDRSRRVDHRRRRRLRHRLLVGGHPRVPPRPAPARDRHRPGRAARRGAGRGRRATRHPGWRWPRAPATTWAPPWASGLRPGDVVVSLGTSGTAFARNSRASADPTGSVQSFADAEGGFLPLVCTLNAARVTTAGAAMLGTDHVGLDRLALAAAPGAGGLTLLPYLDHERTPNLPTATGSLHGLTRSNATPENLARAVIEGMLLNLAAAVDAVRAVGCPVERVLLIGGAAASTAVQEIAPDLFGVPVAVPSPGEYVAVGAARQAAWALAGGDHPPRWDVDVDVTVDPGDTAAGAEIRARYDATVAAAYPTTGG